MGFFRQCASLFFSFSFFLFFELLNPRVLATTHPPPSTCQLRSRTHHTCSKRARGCSLLRRSTRWNGRFARHRAHTVGLASVGQPHVTCVLTRALSAHHSLPIPTHLPRVPCAVTHHPPNWPKVGLSVNSHDCVTVRSNQQRKRHQHLKKIFWSFAYRQNYVASMGLHSILKIIYSNIACGS
jgi:hypothetical protein